MSKCNPFLLFIYSLVAVKLIAKEFVQENTVTIPISDTRQKCMDYCVG